VHGAWLWGLWLLGCGLGDGARAVHAVTLYPSHRLEAELGEADDIESPQSRTMPTTALSTTTNDDPSGRPSATRVSVRGPLPPQPPIRPPWEQHQGAAALGTVG
jgi:hypothetical protein